MISDEICALIISQIRAGREVPELIPMFSDFCKKTTLHQVRERICSLNRRKAEDQGGHGGKSAQKGHHYHPLFDHQQGTPFHPINRLRLWNR
jgi:hypothetical protein